LRGCELIVFLKFRLKDVADVIRLFKLVYPKWQDAVAPTDSDRKVVQDFLKQNPHFRMIARSMVRLAEGDQRRQSPSDT
jgi:hypothetical protein